MPEHGSEADPQHRGSATPNRERNGYEEPSQRVAVPPAWSGAGSGRASWISEPEGHGKEQVAKESGAGETVSRPMSGQRRGSHLGGTGDVLSGEEQDKGEAERSGDRVHDRQGANPAPLLQWRPGRSGDPHSTRTQ